MRKNGINSKGRNRKAELKRMADIQTMMTGGKVKTVKRRGKDKGVRRQDEAALRNDIINKLRKAGCKVYRVENAVTGKNNTGLGDLLVFNTRKNYAAWLEVKTDKGRLQDNQIEFSDLCLACGMEYHVVRSVDESLRAVRVPIYKRPMDITKVWEP